MYDLDEGVRNWLKVREKWNEERKKERDKYLNEIPHGDLQRWGASVTMPACETSDPLSGAFHLLTTQLRHVPTPPRL